MHRLYLPSERDTTWPSSTPTLQVGVFDVTSSAATEIAITVRDLALTMVQQRETTGD